MKFAPGMVRADLSYHPFLKLSLADHKIFFLTHCVFQANHSFSIFSAILLLTCFVTSPNPMFSLKLIHRGDFCPNSVMCICNVTNFSHSRVTGDKGSHLMADLGETPQHPRFAHSPECSHTKILTKHKPLGPLAV